MDERHKIDVAVFRYGVIQELVSSIDLNYGEKEALIREKCARKWRIPFSQKTSISKGTIKRWIKLYEKNGHKLESLYPKDRNDKGKERVLDQESCLTLKELRKEMPDVTVSFILETLKERGIPPPNGSLSTIYRFFNQHKLMRKSEMKEDRRKFEEKHPNGSWQSDVMHGPSVEIHGKKHKTYLIAFIDDHSRLIVYGQFYGSETTNSFMHAFEQGMLRRGLPRKLYVDNGSAFRSRQLMHTTASLGIALIHARPYKPQGKGKIERFFKTVRSGFLPGFKGTTLEDINQSFEEWLAKSYNGRKHSATGQTPLVRFTDGLECVRSTPDDLKDHFRKVVLRKVNKDRTIILDKRLYEGPVELIGKKVEVLYHGDDYDRVELKYKQKSYGFIRMVDLNVNCRVKRDKNNDPVLTSEGTVPETGKMWEETS